MTFSFKVTFSSPSWRSLNHLKGSLNHSKKVTSRIAGYFASSDGALVFYIDLPTGSFSQLARSPNWPCVPFPHALGSSFSQPRSLISHIKTPGLQITLVESGNFQGIICERISFPEPCLLGDLTKLSKKNQP